MWARTAVGLIRSGGCCVGKPMRRTLLEAESRLGVIGDSLAAVAAVEAARADTDMEWG